MLDLVSAFVRLLSTYAQRGADRAQAKEELAQKFIDARHKTPGYGLLVTPIILAVSLHFTAVLIYSIFWCADCAYPKGWTIAAPPQPYDQYVQWVMLYLFGVAALTRRGDK